MRNKTWTKQEQEYLIEKWGTLPIKRIAKNLNRTELAVINKADRLHLGAFLASGDYITYNELLKTVTGGTSGYKLD